MCVKESTGGEEEGRQEGWTEHSGAKEREEGGRSVRHEGTVNCGASPLGSWHVRP